MMAIGRVCSDGHDEGTGFALAPRLAVTANHVARDGPLSFAVGGRTIAVERVARDEALDVAVLHLAEDAPRRSRPAARSPTRAGASRPAARQRSGPHRLDRRHPLAHHQPARPRGAGDAALRRPARRLARRLLGRPGHVAARRRRGGRRARGATAPARAAGARPGPRGQQRPLRDPHRGRDRHFELDVELQGGAPGADGAAPDVVERVSGLRISPAVEHWRDRDELLAKLRVLLVAHEHRLISVVGRRGIGKSALVAKVLAEFETPNPARDPIEDLSPLVYLSSRRSGELTLAGVYQAVAAVWGGEAGDHLAHHWQSAGEAGLPDLWRTLRDRRPVLVLDNLDDLQRPLTHELEDPELVALLDSACRTPFAPTIVTTSQRPLGLPADLAPHTRVLEIPAGLTGMTRSQSSATARRPAATAWTRSPTQSSPSSRRAWTGARAASRSSASSSTPGRG
jgi:hypothetical protein